MTSNFIERAYARITLETGHFTLSLLLFVCVGMIVTPWKAELPKKFTCRARDANILLALFFLCLPIYDFPAFFWFMIRVISSQIPLMCPTSVNPYKLILLNRGNQIGRIHTHDLRRIGDIGKGFELQIACHTCGSSRVKLSYFPIFCVHITWTLGSKINRIIYSFPGYFSSLPCRFLFIWGNFYFLH